MRYSTGDGSLVSSREGQDPPLQAQCLFYVCRGGFQASRAALLSAAHHQSDEEDRGRFSVFCNQKNGIVPKTIIKSVRDLIEISSPTAERKGCSGVKMTKAEKEKEIARLEKQMKEAARMMEYEYAAILRDQIIELRGADK